MTWTTPEDIKAQVQRYWDRGHLLAPPSGEPLFPLLARFSRPEPRELVDRFDDVRRWIRELEEGSRVSLGFGYEIRWSEIRHRQLGTNRVPSGIVVPTPLDALVLIGKRDEAELWRGLVASTERACPTLVDWVLSKPMTALTYADEWARVLAVITWFQEHPRPEIYLRQVDVAGADTKFIESRRGLIAELLDHALPPEAVNREMSPTRQFERRYGLRAKPALVRFRILDERLSIRGMTDLTTTAVEFGRLELSVRRVFIAENEINGLVFPPMSDSVVIFGLGYGLERLAEIGWLRDKTVHYWGDIDTHGFAMLDRLRATLPETRSLLMDRETLIEHAAWWEQEPTQHEGALDRLDESERRLYEELREDRLGPHVRLEQERIGFSWLELALRTIRG